MIMAACRRDMRAWRSRWLVGGWTVAIAATATPATAQAQILRPPPVSAQVQSVADQPRPEWEPLGIPLGPLLVHPSIELGLLGKTNVRATGTGKRSDLAGVATARLAAETGWGRHYLGAEGYARRTEYAALKDESRSEFGMMMRGRYDVSATSNLNAIAQFDRLTQPREDINAPDNARTPGQVDRYRGNLSWQFDNGLALVDADLTIDRRSYRSTTDFNGAIIDQTTRDFTRYQGSLKLGYAISGSTSLLVAGSVNKRVFDELSGTINRGSSGGTIEAGLLWRPSSLLSAEVRAGYLTQRFRAPQLNDARGLSFNSRIVWNALPLTSFRLEASRKVSESSASTIEGQLLTTATFGVDREILPNVIASAEASYERLKYIGISRHSTQRSVGLKARYLLSRLTMVDLSVQHVKRTATAPGDRFSGQQAMLGIRFTL